MLWSIKFFLLEISYLFLLTLFLYGMKSMHVKLLKFLMFIPWLQQHADVRYYCIIERMVSRFHGISDYYRFPFIFFLKIPKRWYNTYSQNMFTKNMQVEKQFYFYLIKWSNNFHGIHLLKTQYQRDVNMDMPIKALGTDKTGNKYLNYF